MSLETGKPCLSVTGLYLDVSVVLHTQNINRWSRTGWHYGLLDRKNRQTEETDSQKYEKHRTDRQADGTNKQTDNTFSRQTDK